jgi:predicted TIM-barrel fold metal-dependent hydrolase
MLHRWFVGLTVFLASPAFAQERMPIIDTHVHYSQPTYVTGRWDQYGRLIDEHRRWLAHLPKAAAEAIAWRNAQRLFGACAGRQLTN